jgi:putative acetyltransferase
MSGVANPQLAMRPFLPADVPLLAEIFRASIEALTVDDYDDEQREAWTAAADDEAAFGERLASELTLIATVGGSAVGFISLEGKDHLDFLYVHPAVAGQGVGAMLCDAIERLAAARGASRLVVEASDTAQGFFAKRGFSAQQRNTVLREGVWLANTTMEKKLPGSDGKPGGTPERAS